MKGRSLFVYVLQTTCSYEFLRIHKETPAQECLFSKIEGWRPGTL